MARFYGYFAAAYGTFWFVLVVAAVASQSHINAGAFGLVGFPIIALLYAIVRSSSSGGGAAEITALRERIRQLELQISDHRDA